MVIKIGEVTALSASTLRVIPDDRQTMIETIGGVVVQDFGHVEAGDKFSCTAVIRPEDKDIIFGYWHNRTRVQITDNNGNVLENMRVKIKGYEDLQGFRNHYHVEFEFWKE